MSDTQELFDKIKSSRAVLTAAPPARGGVRVAVDVDPQSFM